MKEVSKTGDGSLKYAYYLVFTDHAVMFRVKE
jgi:hypothetical protein